MEEITIPSETGKNDIYNVITTNSVPEFAGFWLRVAAFIVDDLIIRFIAAPFALMWFKYSGFWDTIKGFQSNAQNMVEQQDTAFVLQLVSQLIIGIIPVIFTQLLFFLFYFAFWESSKYRATPGKLAIGLQVTDIYGNQLTFMRALGRNFSKLFSSITFGIGYMLAGWTDKKQALHDMIASCFVVKKQPEPETVITQEYAGFWRRLVAFLLDQILLSLLSAPIQLFLVPRGYTNPITEILINPKPELPEITDFIVFSYINLLVVLLYWFYYASWESSKHQATPGKLAIGIKVTDLQGNPVTYWRASARYVNKWVSIFTLLFGYLMAGWTPKKQALHDIFAGCLVVKI
jgi:uncharacterized RDD family membrane protein YckC